MRAIHLLLPVLTASDAIGETTMRLQARLRDAGFESEIFASLVDSRFRGRAHLAGELPSRLRDGDAVVYQLSIGSPLAGVVRDLPAIRVIYYQNISPDAEMQRFSAVVAHNLRWGRRDLAALAPVAELCIAPSTFSLNELRDAGASSTALVPLDVDLTPLRPRPSEPVSPPRFLFVGRFAPHKRQDHLIRVLAAIRRLHCPDARLVLAGGASIPRYVDALRELARQLDVANNVDFHTAGLSAAAIGDLYAEATAFLCASEHEGFCVPLVEAMAFEVPVIAFDGGASAETLGGTGLVVDNHDPFVWADLAWRLVQNVPLRDTARRAARERHERLARIDGGRMLVSALEQIATK